MKKMLQRLFLTAGALVCLASLTTASAAVIDQTAPYEGDYFIAYNNRSSGDAASSASSGPMPASLLSETEVTPVRTEPGGDVIAVHTDDDGQLRYQVEPRDMEFWAQPPEDLFTTYSARAADAPKLGDRRNFITTNQNTGKSVNTSFTLKYSGEYCNIWLESADKRGITDEMIVELGAEYDVKIHTRMTAAFGPALDRDGDGKIAFLLYDIQDPFSISGNGFYIGGYFMPKDLWGNEFNRMDVLHIDTYPSIPASKDLSEAKSTMVHELQHLLESSANYWALPVWINEGLSLAAEHMFYGPLNSRIDYYNTSVKPGVALAQWDNGESSLSHYSISYLFFQYLRIQTKDFTGGGEELYRYIVHSGERSAKAVENAMQQFYPNISFQELFRNFYIALTLKEPTGLYGFGGETWADAVGVKLYHSTGSYSLGPGAALVKSMTVSQYDPTPDYKGHISYAAFSPSAVSSIDSPRSDVPSGNIRQGQTVYLSCGEPNATIYYTLDGSDPDENSPVYVRGRLFLINDLEEPVTVTLKAVTITSDGRRSEMCEYEYTLPAQEPTPAPPTIGSYGTVVAWDTAEAPDRSGIVQVGQIDKAAFGTGGASGLEPHEGAEQEGYIAKYDYDGTQQWIHTFGGDYVTHFYSVAVVEDGYVVSGYYDRRDSDRNPVDHAGDLEDVDILPDENPYGAFLVKFDLEGNKVWLTTFPDFKLSSGGDGYDSTYCNKTAIFHISPCSDGGFVASGYCNGPDLPTYKRDWITNDFTSYANGLVLKVDAGGKLLWRREFPYSQFFSVSELSNGSIAAVGTVRCSALGSGVWAGCPRPSSNNYDSFGVAVAFDQDGNISWKNTYGKKSANGFFDLTPLPDGGLVAVGVTKDDSAVAPLSASLAEEPELQDRMVAIVDHRMALAVRMGPAGQVVWSHVLNDGRGQDSNHYFSSVGLSEDGVIALLTCYRYTVFGSGELSELPKDSYSGVVTVKFDLDSGTIEKVERHTSSTISSDYAYSLTLSPLQDGRFVVGGVYYYQPFFLLLYDGTILYHDVKGTVKLSNGTGLSGVSIGQATSGLGGPFRLKLKEGESATLTPSLPGYTFSPASIPVTMGLKDITGLEFIATEEVYTLSGTITDKDGSPLSGVAVGGTVTDSSGKYTLTARPGASLVLTPAMAGKTFEPAHYTLPSVSQDTSGLDFRVPKAKFIISGSVTRDGKPQGGVRIGNVITEPDGSYTLTVEEGDKPTLSPVFQAYAFQPMVRKLSSISDNVDGQDFIMLPSPMAVEVSPLQHDFGDMDAGYEPISTITVTLTNTGEDPYPGLTVSLPEGSGFELGALTGETLEAGASVTFTVRPKDSLPAGEYSDIITISADGLCKYVTVSFQVQAKEEPPKEDPPDTPKPPSSENKPSGEDKPSGGNKPSGGSSSSGGSTSSGGSGSSSPSVTPQPEPPVPSHAPYLKGYQDGTFRPDNELTRAQCAAILARLSPDFDPEKDYSVYNVNVFSDVPQELWYAGYIGYAKLSGLVTGYPDGTFRPDDPITRGEFATIVRNALGREDAEEAPFPDAKDHWAHYAIGQLAQLQILDGYPDGSFRPDASITRAEAVKVLNLAFDRAPEPERLQNQPSLSFPDLAEDHWAYFNIYEAAVEHQVSAFHP